MVGPSNSNSYGFFGKGYWGKKVFWDKVPVQQQQLDTDGHLENLLRSWGDECESFLQQIANLPRQREPYEVRGRDNEAEWFYFTEAVIYDDDHWGNVVRLVGEKLYANMPNHDEDDTPTSDADDLAEWWAWWPYAPISQVARWWSGSWDDTAYDVVRVRTRSFDWADTPFNAEASQGNEVWLRGGDLRIYFDYFTDDVAGDWREDWTNIGTGDGMDTPPVALPYLPARISYNDTTAPLPWLIANARLKVRLDLTVGGADFDLYDAPDGTTTETGHLCPEDIGVSGIGINVSFAISGDVITLSDTTAFPAPGPFLPGVVGSMIRITGTANNDGVFTVASYIDTYNITYVNAGGATEAGAIGNKYDIGNEDINIGAPYGTVNYQTGKVTIDVPGDTVVVDSLIRAKWDVRGYYLPFYPPRVIDYLARDFGFNNDKNDPEDVQRSTIANITKYHGLKATQDSYRIRGEVSLFDVYTRALWFVCDAGLWASLPDANKFTYHGENYTDLEPRYIRFDDIAADQEFWNPDTAAWTTLVDNAIMYLDTSADGYSVALGYGLDVAQGMFGRVNPASAILRDPAGIMSVVGLTNAEAVGYGLQAGYRVVIRMMRCQEYAFNWKKGRFGITEYDKTEVEPPEFTDPVFWIDAIDTPWAFSTIAWQAGAAYYVGNIVNSAAGDTFRCLIAGVSGGPAEPAWDPIVGNMTVDGGVTWVRILADEDLGDWTVIVGVGVDAGGTPANGPLVGHAEITAVNMMAKKFTIAGDHTGTISKDDFVSVIRSSLNDGTYKVATVTLVGTDTEVVMVTFVPSTVLDGELIWTDCAIRYYPEVDMGNCCFCKSYKVRVEVEPTADAYSFYDTNSRLDAAIDRMKGKIAPSRESPVLKSSIIPIHARVVDWSITKSFTLENVFGSNVIDEEIGVAPSVAGADWPRGFFLSDPLGDVVGVDQVSHIFTINGDQRAHLAVGDDITIRGSTGNDDLYTVSSVVLNTVSGDTDVGVTIAIVDATIDGKLHPMPTSILMTVDQRGEMGGVQTQTMSVEDETGGVVWTSTLGTGADDAITWYNVATDVDVLLLIGNNSPVKIEGSVGVGPITYGDVRFTFTISKYAKR